MSRHDYGGVRPSSTALTTSLIYSIVTTQSFCLDTSWCFSSSGWRCQSLYKFYPLI